MQSCSSDSRRHAMRYVARRTARSTAVGAAARRPLDDKVIGVDAGARHARRRLRHACRATRPARVSPRTATTTSSSSSARTRGNRRGRSPRSPRAANFHASASRCRSLPSKPRTCPASSSTRSTPASAARWPRWSGANCARSPRNGQVLCVTHLPQVACQSDHQLRVSKHVAKGATRTRIEALDEAARVEEIARMLGGTPDYRTHARTRARDADAAARSTRTSRVEAQSATSRGQLAALHPVRANLADAVAVQGERVVGDRRSRAASAIARCRSSMSVVREFLDPAAVDADDVVVVHAFVQFEDGRAALEMMTRHEARRFELRQNPVDRGESDVLVEFEQPAIDVFGTHVPDGRARKDFENLDPRRGDLQSRATQLRRFHVIHPVVERPRQRAVAV